MTESAAPVAPAELGYAGALAELEAILGRLEDDDVDIDLLATDVERAAELIRFCRGRIVTARTDVERVVADLAGDTAAEDDE
ncbi:MAG: exodeoxyribonuclease VII small subunit [Actinomycetota bacterium]